MVVVAEGEGVGGCGSNGGVHQPRTVRGWGQAADEQGAQAVVGVLGSDGGGRRGGRGRQAWVRRRRASGMNEAGAGSRRAGSSSGGGRARLRLQRSQRGKGGHASFHGRGGAGATAQRGGRRRRGRRELTGRPHFARV
jgi:hypothetical protein